MSIENSGGDGSQELDSYITFVKARGLRFFMTGSPNSLLVIRYFALCSTLCLKIIQLQTPSI